MKKFSHFVIVILLQISSVFSENINSKNRELLSILHSNANWNIIEVTNDSISISEKTISGSELNAIKVEKVYDIEPKYFTEIIMDVGNYNSFLSNAKSLKSEIIKNTSDGLIGYQRINVNLPFFDDREYYFYMSQNPFDYQFQQVMCYWLLLDPKHDQKNLTLSDNAIYLKQGAGLWKWEQGQTGRIKISYILTMHPGGSIPEFVVEKINKSSIVGLLRDVETEVITKNSFSD